MIHFFTFDPEWCPARIKKKGKVLVLFDGVCGLCDQTIQTLLKEDRDHVLTFAPLQGPTAQKIISSQENLDTNLKSLIFVDDWEIKEEKTYLRSEGVLRIGDTIGGFWRVLSWFRIVPSFIRDAVYNWVATNRYRWFGKFEACKIPSAETRARFLE